MMLIWDLRLLAASFATMVWGINPHLGSYEFPAWMGQTFGYQSPSPPIARACGMIALDDVGSDAVAYQGNGRAP
ncbi:uncharacterized protein F4812DRAFT_461944 [Daldinia caldariorum]|uniref:uncharacterized protein n=1 Tax=Daldinia caldariorum TaxID=326644 RepID=UPI002007F3DE|nr:uncharacterized protein F4812DRAFT_461944 [Daldinia caldariorum]KAI1465100.1 hypothetical protein F4812DRAFT_461944 [Daldinia caldariorum]